MHWILARGFLFQLAGVVFCAQYAFTGNTGKKYPAYYREKIIADGKLNDWSSGMFYDNAAAYVLYAVANDSSRLCFAVQVLDRSNQMEIIHSGITFRIETTGKKAISSLQLFRRPGRPSGVYESSQEERRPSGQGKPDFMPENEQRMKGAPVGMKLTGFGEGFDREYSTEPDPGNGLKAAMIFDTSGILVIEVLIPLRFFPVELSSVKYIALEFDIKETGGMMPPDNRTGETGMKGMPENGNSGGAPPDRNMSGSGMPSGGRQGGGQDMGPGSGPGMNETSRNHNIKHKFCFADR